MQCGAAHLATNDLAPPGPQTHRPIVFVAAAETLSHRLGGHPFALAEIP